MEEEWHPMEKQPGWEEDERKAEEVAGQQNVNASLAAQFRTQAKELAGGDPSQSDNPMVKQWLEMASAQDQLAVESRGVAEANYDARQAKILAMIGDLMSKVTEGAMRMQRGEVKENESMYYGFTPTPEQVIEAQGLGLSDDDFRREYRGFVLQSFGLSEEKVDQLKSEFEKEKMYPFYTRTVIPNVYLRVGRASMGDEGIAEGIQVSKESPKNLL